MEAWLDTFQSPASQVELRAVHNEITDILLRWQLKPPGREHLEALFNKVPKEIWCDRWTNWLRAASTTLRERMPFAQADQAALIQRYIEKTLGGGAQARYEANAIVEVLKLRVGNDLPIAVNYKAAQILTSGDPNPDYSAVEYMLCRDAPWLPALRSALEAEFGNQQTFVKSLRETPSFNIPPGIWQSTINYAAKQACTDLTRGYAAGDNDRIRGGINTLMSLVGISAAKGKEGLSMVDVLAAQMDGHRAAAEKLLHECMQAVSPKMRQPEKQHAPPVRTAQREHNLAL
jgi:hypothetical protein